MALITALKKAHAFEQPELEAMATRVFGSDVIWAKVGKKSSKDGAKEVRLQDGLRMLRQPLVPNLLGLEAAMELTTGSKKALPVGLAAKGMR